MCTVTCTSYPTHGTVENIFCYNAAAFFSVDFFAMCRNGCGNRFENETIPRCYLNSGKFLHDIE